MADIPTLRGFADETSNLPQLGQTLSGLLGGGDYQMQQAIKKMIATDPDAADKLGQLSRDNPQLFGALRLGKLGNQISQQPVGYKEKAEGLALQKSQGDIQETAARTTNLQNDNTMFPVRKSIMDYQLADLKDKNAKLEEQTKGYPGLKRGLADVADDVMSGKNPPELSYIAQNPGLDPVFRQVLQNKQQLREINAAADRQTVTQQGLYDRMFQREDKGTEKKAMDEGLQMVKRYNVGTPQTWAQWISDPTTQSTVEGLVQNGLPKGMENDEHLRNLRAIGLAVKQNRDLFLDAASRQNTTAADRILSEIKSGKLDRTTGLTQANTLLDENAQNRGTRRVQLVTGDQVAGQNALQNFIHRNTIVAVDPITHEKVSGDVESTDDISKYTNQPPTQSYTAQDLAQAKAALPTASDADLKLLQTKHPILYQALLPDIQRIQMQKKAAKQNSQ